MFFFVFKHPFLRRFYESFPRTRRFRVFRVIRSFNKLAQERSAQSVQSNVNIFSMFRYNSTLSNSTCAHGAQFNTQHSTLNIHTVAQAGARTCCHALSWWALRCLLSSRTASSYKQKKYLIMIFNFILFDRNQSSRHSRYWSALCARRLSRHYTMG